MKVCQFVDWNRKQTMTLMDRIVFLEGQEPCSGFRHSKQLSKLINSALIKPIGQKCEKSASNPAFGQRFNLKLESGRRCIIPVKMNEEDEDFSRSSDRLCRYFVHPRTAEFKVFVNAFFVGDGRSVFARRHYWISGSPIDSSSSSSSSAASPMSFASPASLKSAAS